MKKKGIKEIMSKFHHMGLVVKDAEDSAKFFESLGIGPFKPSKLVHYDRKVYGKPNDEVKIKANVTTLGPVGFEVVQPVEGKSIQKVWIDEKGESINHLCFIVDDIDEACCIMLDAGFKEISSGKNEGGGGMAYFIHDKLPNFQVEFDQLPNHLSDDFYWGNKPWLK